jgi:hypothetical protein
LVKDTSHAEEGDVCRYDFGLQPAPSTPPTTTNAGTNFDQTINGHSYYLQSEFDSAAMTVVWPGVPCLRGVNLEPRFTAPSPVNAKDYVGFNALASDLDLNANGSASNHLSSPVYSWNFGDPYAPSGQNVASGPSQFHAYRYAGTYTVTLRITDSGKNTGLFSQAITVNGELPPKEPVGPGGTGSSSSMSSSSPSPSSAAGGGLAKSTPTPAATASILSRSLRNVLRTGLLIRYSVNERVTGHFEVLLATSVARRIGLHGSPATGLAKGTASQTIIGRAILVTTTGGHSTVKIQFSKATATRLRHLHSASLMLRLIVRNASAGTATVLSTISLSG